MGYIFHESTDHCLLVGTTYGRLVVWEKPGSGDKFAPYKDPVGNLDLVAFCSDFDYYAAASGFPANVTINHASIAADAGTTVGFVTAYNSITETDYTLATHGLGYEPDVMVSVNGVDVPCGFPVQVGGAGARRCVSVYVDSTKVWLRESARPSIPGLPAISLVYRVTAFRDPGDVAGAPLYTASPARVRLGYGRVDSDEKTLREADTGETEYAIPRDVTMDIANGQVKFALPDGTQRVVGPISGSTAYNGNFYGGASKQVTI